MPTIEHIAPDIGFGTSGVRALVSQLTDRVVYAYAAAFFAYLENSGQRGDSGKVVLAHDLRPSSPAIATACSAAATAAGLAVDYAGALPTPALALRAMALGSPGIMVTGSHIPFDRNGIKFYTAQGEILKADESGIRAALFDLPEHLFAEARLHLPPALPAIEASAALAYKCRYLDFFPAAFLAGKRIGVYQHSGVARDLLADLFRAFGAEAVCLGRSDQFIPIDTEAVSAVDTAQARSWCAEHRLDALVSTDGDADRPLLFDETGTMLRGDIIGILTAWHLAADAVATPVSSNTSLELCGHFRQIQRTRIGSPYVIEAMQALAEHATAVVGFEANGGFLVGSELCLDGRRLAPLPTRDALLPLLAVFALSHARRLKLSQLPGLLPQRFTASDRMQGIATALSQALIEKLGNDSQAVQTFFQEQGGVAALDRTDGLRATLTAGGIVHLRPSGNAPELRCYTEAETPEAAASLLAWGMQRLERFLNA